MTAGIISGYSKLQRADNAALTSSSLSLFKSCKRMILELFNIKALDQIGTTTCLLNCVNKHYTKLMSLMEKQGTREVSYFNIVQIGNCCRILIN
jgi:hypothetical protein